MADIRKSTIRFNLDNEIHKEVYKFLKELDPNVFPSANNFMIQGIYEYTKGIKSKERDEEILNKIETTINEAVYKAFNTVVITEVKDHKDTNEVKEEIQVSENLLDQIDQWNE